MEEQKFIPSFTPTSEPWKQFPWQITKGLDKFGNPKMQIKYYSKNKTGGWNFQKYQVIYASITDYKELLKSIKGK